MSFEWAKVGAKVICINDNYSEFNHLYPYVTSWQNTLDGLTKGKIYTIRDVYIDREQQLLIRLYEIIRSITHIDYIYFGSKETGFNIKRFRPLITKTIDEDIHIFTSILETKKKELINV